MLIIILTWTGIAAAPKKGAAKKNADNLNVCKKKVSRKSNRRCRSMPFNPISSSRLGRYGITLAFGFVQKWFERNPPVLPLYMVQAMPVQPAQ